MDEMERLIRNVRVADRGVCDVLIRGGLVAAAGPDLSCRGEVLDGGGGALLPGLHDHHIHLLATAARFDTLDLSAVSGPSEAQAGRMAKGRGLPCAQLRSG